MVSDTSTLKVSIAEVFPAESVTIVSISTVQRVVKTRFVVKLPVVSQGTVSGFGVISGELNVTLAPGSHDQETIVGSLYSAELGEKAVTTPGSIKSVFTVVPTILDVFPASSSLYISIS